MTGRSSGSPCATWRRSPELLEVLWRGLLGALYSEFADWLSAQAARERVAVNDPRSTAAVLLASLTYPAVLEALVDRLPGDVDTVTYLKAWVDSATATLRPVAAGAS